MNNENASTWYGVMMVRKDLTVTVLGLEQTFEYPHMPLFKTKVDAEKAADSKFQIIEMFTKKALETKEQ